ncbi:MAG: peptide chain release factor 1 [Nitrospinae bacterium RIFCSPLOWO2_12_FULL_45_22]|nr:MAG: peptide chain release factor 1 [Nitrospinae bacterium RIFCSPLOWO2_12_FULL_45_22]
MKDARKFGVNIQKEKALQEKMEELGVREQDLVEKFIRSSGPGGQKTNKVATCVYLKHIPSGIEVKVQRERSQTLNRFLARRLIVEKIENELLGRLSAEQQLREKIRRQKRKRSKRAKEKILQQKKLQSHKKLLRTPPGPDE